MLWRLPWKRWYWELGAGGGRRRRLHESHVKWFVT